MKSTALLMGPYDWDPVLLPRAEFGARLAKVRLAMATRCVTGLVVHGNSAEHGALAYLTGFTPKLGPAFAFVPMQGPVRLLVSGSANMLGAAKRLTWVEDLHALGDPRLAIAEWVRMASESAVLGLWGRRAITKRLHLSANLVDFDDPLDTLRLRKSHIEREMIVRACRCLAAANEAFAHAVARDAGTRTAAIEAERAAFHAGAQDFRILASSRDGGPPLPFYGTADLVVRPVLVCMAARFAGYWAEGLTTIGTVEGDARMRAEAALATMLENARAGVTFRDLAEIAETNLQPYIVHSLVQPSPCSSIGLSLDEPSDSLEAGGVYTLRAGAAGAGADNAIVSAMIAVNQGSVETLWSGVIQ